MMMCLFKLANPTNQGGQAPSRILTQSRIRLAPLPQL